MSLPGLQVKEGVSLAPYTTIGIGGSARYFFEAGNIEELRESLKWAAAEQLPTLILGGGSNMLISDNGWSGLVIANRLGGIQSSDVCGERVRLEAGGGVDWDELVDYSVSANLQGIECLSGIPGTVGASPIQNIGAYGQEVKDTIEWVEVMDRSTGNLRRFNADECGFAYRWSRFKGQDKDKYVVTRVAFLLRRNAMPTLRYGDLTRYFETHQVSEPNLADVRNAVIDVRRSKGMVVAPDIPDSRSCGSFFMNPIVSLDEAARIREIVQRDALVAPGDKIPEYPAGEGQVKLSAAWLMEKAGLRKGYRSGNVGLSSCHVLALVNRGEGSAREIVDLVKHVKKVVSEKFGIELHPEPVFIGFDQNSDQNITKAGQQL